MVILWNKLVSILPEQCIKFYKCYLNFLSFRLTVESCVNSITVPALKISYLFWLETFLPLILIFLSLNRTWLRYWKTFLTDTVLLRFITCVGFYNKYDMKVERFLCFNSVINMLGLLTILMLMLHLNVYSWLYIFFSTIEEQWFDSHVQSFHL